MNNDKLLNFGTCRTQKCIVLPANAATQGLVSNLGNAINSDRSVTLELLITPDMKVKRPINNRRNRVRVFNSASEEVAAVNASIIAITDSEGAVTGFKLLSQAIALPDVTATYSVEWRFMATMPMVRYVQATEVLSITATTNPTI
jgi:hypothetical protein